MKIKTKLILIVAASIILSSLLFIYMTISLDDAHLKERLKDLKEEIYSTKKQELLNYSDMANKVLNAYYQRTKKEKIQEELRIYIDEQSGFLFNILNAKYKKYHTIIDEKKLKTMLIDIIKSARYGKSGYFWINDFKYKMIMHPIKKHYTGKYFKSDPKVPFVALGVDALKKTNKDIAHIQYSFYSPSSKKYEEKASIVRVFKPYNWIIGTGAYIDDLTLQMQKEALIAIKNMRYGKNGYFWINNMQNKMLMHPIKPQYDNKIFIDTPKVPFVQLGTDKLKKIKKDKAFIDYSFYTPATKKYSHKLSIVQLFKPWNWVVGTGVYTDYIDKKISLEERKVREEMNNKIKITLLIATILLIIMTLIMIKVMRVTIIDPLEKFQEALNIFFQYIQGSKVTIKKLDNHSKDEIGLMSQNANIAIEAAVQTHKELTQLRQKLELKVHATTLNLHKAQKDFDTISQDRKASLHYGATILSSLLPNTKRLQDAFSKHFILNKQIDTIHSQLYLFEKIRTNEYLFTLIDTKKEGINSVFLSMLINAIIKQAITQLKYEKDEQQSASWILEYLNENIEKSQEGFDACVMYYNKSENTLRYASSNFPLTYYQDNSFHTINPSKQGVGVDKSIQYEESIIDIKNYIELYFGTQEIEQNFTDASNFVSPFHSDKHQWEQELQGSSHDIIITGFQIDNNPKIIIEHKGEFTQELVNKYIETIEDKIENMGMMSNISTNFVEQWQNILNYAKDAQSKKLKPYGSILLQQNPDATYSIESKNIVSLSDKEKMEPKLVEIQSFDRNAIRKRYRELRRSGENTHSKGGGIGFYEIAKRSSKIEYIFTQINEDHFEFTFRSFITK